MYAQFSTGLAARARYVIGVPPSSCLTIVNDVISYSSTGNTTAVQFKLIFRFEFPPY